MRALLATSMLEGGATICKTISREFGSALEQSVDDKGHGGYCVQGAAVACLRRTSAHKSCSDGTKMRLRWRRGRGGTEEEGRTGMGGGQNGTHIFRIRFKRYQAIGSLVQYAVEFFVQDHLRQSEKQRLGKQKTHSCKGSRTSTRLKTAPCE